MGIHRFNTSVPSILETSLQLLTTVLMPVRRAKRSRRSSLNSEQMVLPFASDASPAKVAVSAAIPPRKPSPRTSMRGGLRIVRVFDAAVSPSCAGRMVISGRMADVCAELERMSQAHAPSH